MVTDTSRAAYLPPRRAGSALDIRHRQACARGRIPPDSAHHAARNNDGVAAGAAGPSRSSKPGSRVRDAGRRPAGRAAGSGDDVEGGRVDPGRSSSRHVLYRGRGETESASRLRAASQVTPHSGRGNNERSGSMNCHDVDRALGQGSPLPLQAEEHARTCNRCQQLVAAVDLVPADAPSPAALRKIAESLAANLRPVRPLAPARYFVGAFVGIFVSIVALSVYRLGAFAIAVMTPLQTTAILSTLAIGTGLLVYSLVKQMVPGSRHRIAPALLAVRITLLLPMVMPGLFQVQPEENFWGKA